MRKILILLSCLLLAAASAAAGESAPEWAGVTLNERGFLDEGEYILEDPGNGHWMYVNGTLRIQITRTWETPEKIRNGDYNQQFFCFTAEIWCDTEAGEGPVTLWADPEKPGTTRTRKTVQDIAREQDAVFAVSTDQFAMREGKGQGVVIRNGEILCDGKPKHHPGQLPPYDTLAIYTDGHVESFYPADKRAEEYAAEGASQVYTFGPLLLRDGEIPEEILKDPRNLNPRHAFGMVEPGHFIDMLCEGRLKSVNGSTGVLTETLAGLLRDRGCVIAVNLDGGDSAVMTFLGKRLNTVAKYPSGRKTCEALVFGLRETEKDGENP